MRMLLQIGWREFQIQMTGGWSGSATWASQAQRALRFTARMVSFAASSSCGGSGTAR